MFSRRTKKLKVDEVVIDYNKNINFEMPGMERPKTKDEVKDHEDRVKLSNYIYKIMSKEATSTDVFNMARHIMYEMGEFLAVPKYLAIDYDENLSGQTETFGFYSSSVDTIFLSYDLLEDVASGNMPIFELFNTIAHECQHVLQKVGCDKILDGQVKPLDEYSQKVFSDYGKHVLTENELGSIVSMISRISDDKEFEKFNTMDPESKHEYLQTISFSQYSQYAHEVDARLAGINFSAKMYNEIMQDPIFSNETKRWIESQKKSIDKFIDAEKEYQNLYGAYNNFKKHFEDFKSDEIVKLSSEIGKFMENVNKNNIVEDTHQFELVVLAVYSNILKLHFENKNTEQINSIISIFLQDEVVDKSDYTSHLNTLFDVCLQNKNIDMDLVSNNICNLIINKKTNPVFLRSHALKFLTQNDLNLVLDTLIKEDRTQDIFSIFEFCIRDYSFSTSESNFFNKRLQSSPESKDAFMKKLLIKTIDYSNNFLHRLNRGNIENITYKDLHSIRFFWNKSYLLNNTPKFFKDSFEKYSNLFVESANEEFYESCRRKISKRDQDKEITEQKYGKFRAKGIKSRAESIKELREFIHNSTDLTVYNPHVK